VETSINRIRIKTERAKEHIRDLKTEIGAFFSKNPYKIGAKRNSQTRKPIYYVTDVAEIPERISAIVGDVLQNLRSALDHLAYALFMIGPGGRAGAHGNWVYFPICDDASKYATESPRKIKGLGQDAIDSINATKPYKGGNDTIWLLHKLNNIDKHRFVILVGGAFRSMDLGAIVSQYARKAFPQHADMPTLHAFFSPGDPMFPLKVGDELYIGAPDEEMNEEMQFAFDIAFGEPGIIEGKPLIETLQSMANLIDNLLTDFAPLLP
jgi:hypothetical protein